MKPALIYKKVLKTSLQARILEGVSSLLGWDQETYMPDGSAPIRALQIQTMAGITHRLRTGKKFWGPLSQLIDLKTGQMTALELSSPQQAALKEWRREYLRKTALPASFVEKLAKLSSESLMAWKSARETNTFNSFLPFLEKIIAFSRKKADLIGYKDHPYDALLDEFEPGMTTQEVEALFNTIAQALKPLIQTATAKKVEDQFLYGDWDHTKQMAFGREILQAMGYDFTYGRLDFSSHPFSSASHPTDSRITTRLNTRSLVNNIFILLHEGGHALYEMGLPTQEYGSPLGDARSLGIHESQSRWWETRIGLSLPFWSYFFPKLKSYFPHELKGIELETFYRALHKVSPSFIRVNADEVTYPMHVILRFDLEKQLISGTLQARDIPEAWNAKMKEYLNITPPTDRDGCLQDIHWSMAGFGYFPTYTLGNVYAAHLFDAFTTTHAEWKERVSQGELLFIRDWLKERIYQHGCRYTIHELLHQATGNHSLTAAPYLSYLTQKYVRACSKSSIG